MKTDFVSTLARHVEMRLPRNNSSELDAYVRQLAESRVEQSGFSPSDYHLVAERRDDLAGPRLLSPKRLDLGTFSEKELYGASGSPVALFCLATNAPYFGEM